MFVHFLLYLATDSSDLKLKISYCVTYLAVACGALEVFGVIR